MRWGSAIPIRMARDGSRKALARCGYPGDRAAVWNTMISAGAGADTAERWCDASEAEAERVGLAKDANDWTVASAWIAEQRPAMRRRTT